MNNKCNKLIALILVGLLLLGSMSSIAMSVFAEEVLASDPLSEFEDTDSTDLSSNGLEDSTDDFEEFTSPDESEFTEETSEQDLSGFADEDELADALEELQDFDATEFEEGDPSQEPVEKVGDDNVVENSDPEGFTEFNEYSLDDSADSLEDFSDLDDVLDDFSDTEGLEGINFDDFEEGLDINRPSFGGDFIKGAPKIVEAKWASKPLTTEGESSETSERLVFYFELYDRRSKTRYFTTKLSKDLSFEKSVDIENFEEDEFTSEEFEVGEEDTAQAKSSIEIYKEYITDKFVNKKFSKAVKPSQEDFDKMLVSNMVILHDQKGNKLYRSERVKNDADALSEDSVLEFSEDRKSFDANFLIHQCMNTQVTYHLDEGTELSPEDESNLGLIYTVKTMDNFGNEEEVLVNDKMIFGDGQFIDGESEWLVDTTGNFKLAMRKGTLDLFEENSQIPKDYQIKVKFSNKNLAEKYSLEVKGDAIKGWEVVLKSRIEEIPVQVQWYDNDNEKALRPEKLEIPYIDENGVIQVLELSPENGWRGKIRILSSEQDTLESLDVQDAFDLQDMDAMYAPALLGESASQDEATSTDFTDAESLVKVLKEELDKISIPKEYSWDVSLVDGVIKIKIVLRLHNVSYKLAADSKDILAKNTVIDGETAIELKAPVLPGYEFIAWQLNGEDYDFETPVHENLVLVAAWENQGCTITYEFNNGMPANKVKVKKGSLAKEPTAPTKAHHSFKGWLLNGSEFSFENPITDDITLIADWEITKYKVVFENGVGGEYGYLSVESGNKVKEPKDPVRKGFTFAGWYNGEEAYSFDTVVSKDLKLTAKWVEDKAEKFTVNFHLNNNGSKGTIPSQHIKPGEKVEQPEDPSIEGKIFQGWYYKDEKTGKLKKFDFSTPIKRNYLLIAGWKQDDLTVRLFGQGMPTRTQKVKFGGTPNLKENITIPDGYRLDGWLKDNGKEKYDPSEKIYKDTDLKANLIKTHTISFNSLGGSEVEDQVVDDKTKAKEPDPPVREGYKFLGWGLSVKGKLKKFNFEKVTIDRDYKLKAVWKKQAEGGGDSGDPKDATKLPKTGLSSVVQAAQIGTLITLAGVAYIVRKKLR